MGWFSRKTKVSVAQLSGAIVAQLASIDFQRDPHSVQSLERALGAKESQVRQALYALGYSAAIVRLVSTHRNRLGVIQQVNEAVGDLQSKLVGMMISGPKGATITPSTETDLLAASHGVVEAFGPMLRDEKTLTALLRSCSVTIDFDRCVPWSRQAVTLVLDGHEEEIGELFCSWLGSNRDVLAEDRARLEFGGFLSAFEPMFEKFELRS